MKCSPSDINKHLICVTVIIQISVVVLFHSSFCCGVFVESSFVSTDPVVCEDVVDEEKISSSTEFLQT